MPTALESSIDWFWQTMQRNTRDRFRARDSSAESLKTSSGCTARTGPAIAHKKSRMTKTQRHIDLYSAGSIAGFAAGFGAPTRSRRSDRDSAPPIAITTAPSHISRTIGL